MGKVPGKSVVDGLKQTAARNENYRQNAVSRLVALAQPSRRQKK